MEESSAEMKNKEPKEMGNYLPRVLSEMTLFKLPIKSLLRLTTAAKKWHNVITGTQFVSQHLKYTNSRQDKPLFILDLLGEGGCVLYSEDEEALNATIIEPPEELPRDMILSGCSNGLICLTDWDQDVFLWNPSIRRALRLPEQCNDPDRWKLAFGCVFDHVDNDFKVLRTTQPSEIVAEIFRLSTKVWERYTKEILYLEIWGYQCVLKGFAHWVGLDTEGQPMILSFDVHEEVFGSVPIPATLAEDQETDFVHKLPLSMFLFEESLVLIHSDCEYDENVGKSRTRYDFWKMEEYGKGESWNLWQSLYCYEYRKPLGFRKNGEFLWGKNEEFVSTNLENFSETCLGRREAGHDYSCSNYVESLALLDTTTTTRWVLEEDDATGDAIYLNI